MKTPMRMIDLRPPYPWEEQPKKPREEKSHDFVGLQDVLQKFKV